MLLMLAVACHVRQERELLESLASSVSPVLDLLELSSQPVALK